MSFEMKIFPVTAIFFLWQKMLSCDRKFCPVTGKIILQQDGARCHTSRQTSAFLEGEGVEFMGKEDWPPESGDLNPMDYGVWSMLSEAVYHDRAEPFTVEELKEKIIECWEAIPLEKIQHIISAWKSRLRDVCRAAGGPIEHLRR